MSAPIIGAVQDLTDVESLLVESVVLTMFAKADTSAPTADVNLVDHVAFVLMGCVR